MKKFARFLSIVLLLGCLTACSSKKEELPAGTYVPMHTIPNYTAVPRTQDPNAPTPESEEYVNYGLMYTNADWNILFYILQPHWLYAYDEDTDQVVFYLEQDESGLNRISLSVFPVTDDFDKQTKTYMEAAQKAFKGQAEPGQIYTLTIGADTDIEAVAQPYAYDTGDEILSCGYYYWQKGDTFYVLGVAAQEDHLEQLQSAVGDILNSCQDFSADAIANTETADE